MKAASWLVAAVVALYPGEQVFERLPAELAGLAVGRVATVCGEVMDLGCAGPRGAALTFLTPSTAPPVGVFVDRTARRQQSGGVSAADRLRPRRACVIGTIERRAAGLRVSIERPDQLVFDAPASQPPGQDRALVRRACEPGVEAPRPQREARPRTPPLKLSGRVLLQAVVDRDGSVSHVQVLRSFHPAYDEASAESIRASTWTPGRYRGAVSPVIVMFEHSFKWGRQPVSGTFASSREPTAGR
jgi:hypothetical protein